MDTCAAINTGNLLVHQWLMTTHPHLVAEFIQYDDKNPFETLQLYCAVEDLVNTESMPVPPKSNRIALRCLR